MLLIGDIGGTKTSLGTIEPANRKDGSIPKSRSSFRSDEAESLESLVSVYLAGEGIDVEGAVFAVAGPVIDGQSDITNLPWTISESRLRDALDLPLVRLVNDIEAVALAVPHLKPEEVHTLNPGVPVPGGNIGVIAPGTGLGESFLTTRGATYHAHASEGGHADFAPTNPRQRRLLDYLTAEHGHISYERVCSGMALPDIYRFCRDMEGLKESGRLSEALGAARDQGAVIVRAAMDEREPSTLCRHTMETFVSILGAQAGNLALTVMALGGVYLGGGIPPRILSYLDDGSFMASFLNKGRMSSLMSTIPVHVILTPDAALYGAAGFARSL